MSNVLLCGEDKRFIECKKYLRKAKINALVIKNKKDLENIDAPKIIVLPIQGIKGINEMYKYIFENYHSSIYIIYNVTSEMKEIIDLYKLKTLNLNDLTLFSKLNNIATSEATLKYIVENIFVNFNKIKVAIIGYGKCGKEVYNLYKKLDMKVDVYVRRKEVKEEIGIDGYLLLKLEDNIDKYNLIVNTVPSIVIDDSLLHKIALDSLLLDLASSPYGYDHELAKYLGLNSHLLKGLPGIYRYKEMGNVLSLVIKECLKQ